MVSSQYIIFFIVLCVASAHGSAIFTSMLEKLLGSKSSSVESQTTLLECVYAAADLTVANHEKFKTEWDSTLEARNEVFKQFEDCNQQTSASLTKNCAMKIARVGQEVIWGFYAHFEGRDQRLVQHLVNTAIEEKCYHYRNSY